MTDNSVNDAVKNAAAAQTEAAEDISESAKAKAATDIAEGAQAAAAAAEAGAALANAHAAKTILENEENIEWLRLHATKTESSFQNLEERQNRMEKAIPQMLEAQQTAILGKLSELLTPPASTTENREVTKIVPENQSESADGQREAESKKKKSKDQKRRVNWT